MITLFDMSNTASSSQIVAAEAIGTAILMLGGPGVAVFAGLQVGTLGVALGFGFALLIAAHSIGHISGCHINPAVTIGLWLTKRVDSARVPFYILGQVVGAAVGASIIWIIKTGKGDGIPTDEVNFATNLWDSGHEFYGFWPMVITEVVLTAVLVFVVHSTTRRGYQAGTVGLHVGLTLTMLHLISIPIDNTSVNPARSFGMAIFARGPALEQLWAFVVFPIIGAGLGAMLWMLVDDKAVVDEPPHQPS